MTPTETEKRVPDQSPAGHAKEPLPCPFCGSLPDVLPAHPWKEGDAWGSVRCVNKDCAANPIVNDGETVNDERGSDAYKAIAIARWNRRAGIADPADALAKARAMDWLADNGASLIRQSQPDMGGYDWFVSHPLIPSSRKAKGRTPAEAIEKAISLLTPATEKEV